MNEETPEEGVEAWRPIPGWEGLYEASDLGRVKSIPRRQVRGGILSPSVGTNNYPIVWLRNKSERRASAVHRLVAEAFLGPPEGLEVRHLNGDRMDNRLANLKYGTHSENVRDTVNHGMHHNAKRTHCKRGHEFTPENTKIRGDRYQRICIECARLASRNRQRTKKVRA